MKIATIKELNARLDNLAEKRMLERSKTVEVPKEYAKAVVEKNGGKNFDAQEELIVD